MKLYDNNRGFLLSAAEQKHAHGPKMGQEPRNYFNAAISSISKVEQSGRFTNIGTHEQTKEILMTTNSTNPEVHETQQQIAARSQKGVKKRSVEKQRSNKPA